MKKIFLLLIFLFSTIQIFSEEIFKFKEIEEVDDGRTYCVIERRSDKNSIIFFLDQAETSVFLKKFKEKHPSGLVGKEFSAKWSDFELALDYFFVVQKNKDYIPPTENEFLDRVTDYLSEMKSPEKYISSVDHGTMMNLKEKMWWSYSIRDAWLYKIRTDLKQKTNGRVVLEYDNELNVCKQGVEKFMLTKYNSEKKVIQKKVVVFQDDYPIIFFE